MKYWDHKRALKESVKAQRDIVNISVFDAQQTHLILEPDDQDLPTCWPIHFLDVSHVPARFIDCQNLVADFGKLI